MLKCLFFQRFRPEGSSIDLNNLFFLHINVLLVDIGYYACERGEQKQATKPTADGPGILAHQSE